MALKLAQATGSSLLRLLSLECMSHPLVLYWESLQGHSLRENPVSLYQTLKILVGGCRDLLILLLLKTSLECKFLCLLNLSPINLEGAASVSPCPLWTGLVFHFTQGTPKVVSRPLGSQPGDQRNGEEASEREAPGWPCREG